jgi:hypothetical protein
MSYDDFTAAFERVRDPLAGPIEQVTTSYRRLPSASSAAPNTRGGMPRSNGTTRSSARLHADETTDRIGTKTSRRGNGVKRAW